MGAKTFAVLTLIIATIILVGTISLMEGNITSQAVKGCNQSCIENDECNDKNPCTIDICKKRGCASYCIYINKTAC